jgi:hypothetical protein
MMVEPIAYWVDEAARSLRGVGIDRIPAEVLSEPLVGSDTVATLAALGVIDLKHLVEHTGRFPAWHDVGTDLLSGSVLFVFLRALQVGWDRSRAPEAALVEMLTFFPDDRLLEHLDWKPPIFPMSRSRGKRKLDRMLLKLVELLSEG